MDQLVLTPAGLLELLVQIDELKDIDIRVIESAEGIQLTVGDSTYMLSEADAVEVEVSEETVDEVAEVNDDAYQSLEVGGTVELDSPVESGVLKELLKTLAVGGLVRLTKNLITQ